MKQRADNYEKWFQATTDEFRALAERMLGDARTLGVDEKIIKDALVENVKVEVKEELGEKHREEKREDERRDARRDGERGEKPSNELPGTPAKPSTGFPSATPKK